MLQLIHWPCRTFGGVVGASSAVFLVIIPHPGLAARPAVPHVRKTPGDGAQPEHSQYAGTFRGFPWPCLFILSPPLLFLWLLLILCPHLRPSGAESWTPSSVSGDGNSFPTKQKQYEQFNFLRIFSFSHEYILLT